MSATTHPTGAAETHPVSLGRRLYGFGSVFGKTIRDSRRATLLVGGLLGLALVGVSQTIVAEFATPQSRAELAALIGSVPPILQGLAGPVVNVDTLGGYLQYKYGTFFPIIASLWSIIALSGTLAAESRRGSMEFVAAAPISRRRIALEKVAGHLVAMGVAVALVFIALVAAGGAAKLPGDEIPPSAALGYALWLGLLALAAGGLAFAASQFFGRSAGVGIAGAVMFAGFLLNGYQTAIPAVAPLANLTWFGWTSQHIPLAGRYDWASLLIVAVVAVAFLAVGVVAFVRRDLGATTALPTPSLPRSVLGLRGPVGRTFGNVLPSALSWGLGLGIFGLVVAGSGDAFVQQLGSSPDFVRLLNTIFPGVDITAVGGFLQLVFVEFGLVLAGLAAATLVAGWASDETSGRLEFLLATPLSRRRWVTSGGIGLLGGVAVFVALAAAGIAIGASITGGDIVTPIVGTLVLGVYAVALVGIGVAIGGVVGMRFAGPAVALVTVITWALGIFGPALGLPDAINQLALTLHYGFPMLGHWDPAGVVASLVLAVGGVALGAWGLQRRDLDR